MLNAQTADVIVTHARVWTGNPKQAWAEAFAVTGDRIVAVGSSSDVAAHAGPKTRTIDAKGRLTTPGFIDSHVHFLEGGASLASVHLRDVKRKADFAARMKAYAATVPPGTWITGGEWDHTNWGGELPDRTWIDSFTPNNPVWVNRLDGHMGLANSKALAVAGVTANTKDVAGGSIVRDTHGNPTGILKDNAMDLVVKAIPPPSPATSARALEAASKYAASNGVTAVDHMGTWDDLRVFEAAHTNGTLRTRIYAAVPLATWSRLADLVSTRGRGDDWLTIGGLKGFVDGSLGSHTAALLEPFTDAPNDRGLFVTKPEDLYTWTAAATKAGLHVMVHAIGDRAIRTQLDIYERVGREQHPSDPRFRIEHAQHISAPDVPRFGKLHVIASMQPYHCIDDGRWAEPLIGHERAKTTYAFRTLLDTGARLAFGSDWPVAPATPLEGIYAAVTRRTLDGKHPEGWIPEEKIKVEEAMKAYTSDAAYARFAEKRLGSIEVGKLADFVILDRDITRIPPEQIRDVHVDATYIGGQLRYERK